MLTIKLVVIGASGVGKTSLRGQYISGQFSTGYRATIGADFIAKTLPHPHIPGESITLQIWDTAGQERFASLASAFYRGADAVLLMFDVNRPETLPALRTWWLHFCAHASLAEEDMGRFCVVVSGNKMDLVGTEQGAPEAVSPACAWEAIREMMPALVHDRPAPDSTIIHPVQLSDSEDRADIDTAQVESGGDAAPSESIAIHSQHRISHLRSHSRASSRFDTGTVNTMRSAATIYHTPASSLSFSSDTDIFHSARTSPEHSISLSHSSSHSSSHSYHSSYSLSLPLSSSSSPSSLKSSSSPTSTRSRRNTAFSTSSVSSDGATITPGMLSTPSTPTNTTATNPHPNTTTTTTNPNLTHTSTPSPVTLSGPRLFYTSAKTGAGVCAVFEAVAAQVVGRWACEEVGEVGEVAGASESINVGGVIERGRNVKTGLDLRVGTPTGKLKKGKDAGCCAS